MLLKIDAYSWGNGCCKFLNHSVSESISLRRHMNTVNLHLVKPNLGSNKGFREVSFSGLILYCKPVKYHFNKK